MKPSEHWQINHNSAKRSALAFFLAAIILLIPVIKYSTEHNFNMTFTVILAASISTAMIVKIFYTKFLSKKILIEFGIILIPRFFLRDYRIDCREIAALEVCNTKNSRRTVFIIRREKTPVAVGDDLFTCSEHFEEFISQIKKNIANAYQSEKKIGSIKSLTPHIIPISIAIALIISFFIFWQDFENLSDLALEIGGLTKSSLIPSEFYRLFSSFFLHYNIPHLALNLIALGIFSRPTEMIIGRLRVINVIFISALIGSIFSVLLSPFDVVVGASGGIFGLVGAYTSIYFKYADKLVGSVFITKNVLILTIVLQFLSDAFVEGIDYFSHFFGFTTGMLYAGYLCYFHNSERIANYNSAERICSITLCTVYLLALIYIFIEYNS